MCGIAGFWSTNKSTESTEAIVRRMSDTLLHRGPDDGDSWVDENLGIGLAHRRLSIIDLSQTGHQPMKSADERYVIVFNGEIYNHLDLRSKLAVNSNGHVWRGSSDTETLLECIRIWGVEKTLNSLVGMFAFALFDKHKKELILARDRFGEKPLYYGFNKKKFLFASELKAMRCLPFFDNMVSLKALQLQTQFSYVPEPYSIYEGIFKLTPGSYVRFSQQDIDNKNQMQPTLYWSAEEIAIRGINKPLKFGSDQEAKNALDKILRNSVKGQMMADVPLGAFLSGGIDSSTVVALMQEQSNVPIKTFTIGFNEKGFDEAKFAKNVAKHLGTDHHELYVSATDAMNIVYGLASVYDEPYADASQIPSILVSKLAKTQVTVSLSGDGGDELFGGYSRYFLTRKLWGIISKFPMPIRRLFATMLKTLSPNQWDKLYRTIMFGASERLIGDKLYKAAKAFTAGNGQSLYFNLVTQVEATDAMCNQFSIEDIHAKWMHQGSIIDQMMLFDAISYLPGDILTKMDRAGMSVSLETRIPFLDHNVYEFAWQLGEEYKIRNGVGKWLLREVLYDYVPKNLIDRPKMGFSVPIGSWLRGPLKEWAADLIASDRINSQGIYNAKFINKIWIEHQSGKKNWEYQLWNVLMFQHWLNTSTN